MLLSLSDTECTTPSIAHSLRRRGRWKKKHGLPRAVVWRKHRYERAASLLASHLQHRVLPQRSLAVHSGATIVALPIGERKRYVIRLGGKHAEQTWMSVRTDMPSVRIAIIPYWQCTAVGAPVSRMYIDFRYYSEASMSVRCTDSTDFLQLDDV